MRIPDTTADTSSVEAARTSARALPWRRRRESRDAAAISSGAVTSPRGPKRGQTLDSLQYLTNRVANKSQDGYVRVKLDTEDYRKRRKQTLENLAKNIAYKVKRSRKPISLEPMNPYERRIIHSALQADDRVSTHSEGEEPYRRVVVTPNRR